MSPAITYIDKNRSKFVDDLKELIRIPSVSAVPEHKADVTRCAAWLADHMKELGLKVEVHETPGHPLIYAEWLNAPGQPTALIYGHYDVQPVDPLNLWRNPPFEPTIEGNNLVARGATDDKGQMFAHVKAIEGFMKTDGKLPINVKFLIEGEEEVGSEHLDPWIEKNADKLKCDVVVVSDTAQYGDGIPAITYALRGIAYLEMKVEGPAMDLHSGMFGGTIANPANVLAEILSTIKDRDGRILVDGFYEKVRDLTPAERTEIERLPHDDAEFCRGIGVPKTFGEMGFSTIERRWIRPTFDVNGLFGGYQGEGSKTVLPAWAGAKISFRLVPDQDPHEIGRLVKAHIEKVAPPTVKVSVTALHGGNPVLVPIDGSEMRAARRALAKGFSQEPVMIREGGSIPVVSTFQSVLKAPTLLLGFGRNDDGAHSPNEKFNLDDYHNGIRTSAFLLQELAEKA